MKQETIDGNRLIAEFMGCEKLDYEGFSYYRMNYMKHSPICTPEISMEYHSSWDWLMPVVENINTIAIDNYGEMNVMIQSNQCRIGETWDDSVVITTKANHPILIEMVYTAIITFIKWHEAQKLFIL